MSYYLYDDDGYVGDVASIGGWGALVHAAEGSNQSLDAFFETGVTSDTGAVRNALLHLNLPAGDVASTRDNLAHLMLLARGDVVLSEGYTD